MIGYFSFLSGGIGTGIRKIWHRIKVSELVSVKFGIRKKSRNRYRKNLVPEKMPVSLSKLFGTGKKSIGIGIVFHLGYHHTLVGMSGR